MSAEVSAYSNKGDKHKGCRSMVLVPALLYIEMADADKPLLMLVF